MANVNIKFNNKDYLLSCDDGQEESLKKLTKFLDKKYTELKELAIKYRDSKDNEISELNKELEKFRKSVEENNSLYETMLDKTTKSLEKIILNTESISKIQ